VYFHKAADAYLTFSNQPLASILHVDNFNTSSKGHDDAAYANWRVERNK